jgi:hypothetical protein
MSWGARRSLLVKNNVSGSPPGRGSATEEDAMHPVIIEAVAAERARESQAHAEAAGLARQFRRARRRPSAPPASSARPGLWRLPRPLRHA